MSRISFMGGMAARDCSDGQLTQAATLSIASIAGSERRAYAAFTALERDGLVVDGRHLGSGPAAAEQLAAGTDLVLVMEESAQRARVAVEVARRRARDAGIVVVLPGATQGDTRGLLAGGADALVLESASHEVLAAAVRAASLGQISIPRPFRECLEPPALSHRDQQIIALVAAGCMNAQIAERLSLAESTIKAHLTSVFRRLGVRSRKEAAALFASDDDFRRAVLSSLPPIHVQNVWR
jgi:DNA-binding NarL/FixJ family response regulator